MDCRPHHSLLSIFCVVLAIFAGFAGHSVFAQDAPYTLQANTRVVLTDVTVTDREGNPVRGLKSSDFQILENHDPETIASFEEHVAQPVLAARSAPRTSGVYSNDFMLHLPPALNVMVLDIKNMEIVDQMYLRQRLVKVIQNLAPGQPFAIYWCRGANTVLLQSFTDDRALLLAAVQKALPRFPPTGREFYNDFNTLHELAVDLDQIPGRKNILWFSGGSTLYLRADAAGFQLPDVDPAKIRAVYDELESSRIAIFPIDARGLTVTFGASLSAMDAQHVEMAQVAEATGGRAFYNNNGIGEIATRLLDSGGSFYTLTYSPPHLHFDNKWHKVEIKLTTSSMHYTLSYRRGYFADAMPQTNANLASASHAAPAAPRRLLTGGTVAAVDEDAKSQPIIFQVAVSQVTAQAAGQPATELKSDVSLPYDPAKQHRGTVPYTLHYSVPMNAFVVRTINGKPQAEMGVALLVFNEYGTVASRSAERVVLVIRPEKLPLAPDTLVSVNQEVNLPVGDNSLYCAVWDMTSHRLGTVQIPIKATRQHQQ